MAPIESKPSTSARLTLESWSEGFLVGALFVMAGVTLANMRKDVLLHKLIFVELLLAIPNGFFTFFDPPVWGWYLSATVIPLMASWTLHNVVAWIKSKPFLSKRGSLIYISSLVLIQPYWVLDLYANFAFFNGINDKLFTYTRPFEGPCRDPWWIFTTANLLWNIKHHYEFNIGDILRISPRLSIMICSMLASIAFIIVDLLAVTPAIGIGVINPFWKVAMILKCFTDTIILDDFKTALDKLSQHKRSQILSPEILPEEITMHGKLLHWSRKRRYSGISMSHLETVSLEQDMIRSIRPVAKVSCRHSPSI